MLPQSPVNFKRQRGGGRGGGWRGGEGLGGVGGGVQGGNGFTPSFPSETQEPAAPAPAPAPATTAAPELSNIVSPATKSSPQGAPKATTTRAPDSPLTMPPTRNSDSSTSSSFLPPSSDISQRVGATILSGQLTNTQGAGGPASNSVFHQLLAPSSNSISYLVPLSSSNTVSHLVPAPSSSSAAKAQRAANPGAIIAPVCVLLLALLLLSGVIYFRVTRKRWPFTANKGEDAVLEPYQVGNIRQMDNENLPSTLDSRPRETFGTLEKSFQQRRPQISHQPRLRSDTTIPGEQDLGEQYMSLVLELEEVRSRLLTAGGQPAPRTDQGDEPPGYYSRTSVGEVRQPAFTGEEKRNPEE